MLVSEPGLSSCVAQIWRQRGGRSPAVLHRKTPQAGDDIVITDQFRRTVRAFHSKNDLRRLVVVVDVEVERALAGDLDLLYAVVAASRTCSTTGNDPWPI